MRDPRRLLLSPEWNRPLPGLREATGVNADYFGDLDARVWAALHGAELRRVRDVLQRSPFLGPVELSLRARVAWLQGLHGEAHAWFERAGGAENPWAPGRAWRALSMLPSPEGRAALSDAGWDAGYVGVWRRYAALWGRGAAAPLAALLEKAGSAPAGPRLLRGLAAAKAGRRRAAEREFDRAASAYPDALEGFAVLLGEPGALREGRAPTVDRRVRAAARALAASSPKTWWAHAVAGSCRFAGVTDERALARARAALSEARRLRPGSGWVAALQAQLLWSADPAAAEAAAAAACRLLPQRGWPRAWRGVLALKRGRRAAALRDLAEAAKKDPGYALTYVWRAGASLAARRLDAAERDLDVALALRPGHAGAWEQRAHLRRERGDVAGALAALTRSAGLEPETRRTYDPAARPASRRALARFCAAQPDEPVARLWLGELLLRAGEKAAARRELRRFLAAVAREPAADFLRGWAYEWLGDARRARRLNPALDLPRAC